LRVALVNTNRITPPVAPIGLDYVAEALCAAGHEADILDLCWEERWEPAIARFLGSGEYGLIGVTVRNTDDCSFATRESFLPTLSSMVECIRKHTGAPIVLGGVGFSIGEFSLAELSGRLESNRPWNDLPGLVVRRDGKWRRNPGSARTLTDLPPMSRSFLDNRRYFREGGQAGIETKRGCPRRCISSRRENTSGSEPPRMWPTSWPASSPWGSITSTRATASSTSPGITPSMCVGRSSAGDWANAFAGMPTAPPFLSRRNWRIS
jgi:hypothetical protein